MDDRRKAKTFAGLAIMALLVGCALAATFPGVEVEIVAVAFVGYVAFGRRAVILSRTDDLVFERRHHCDPRTAAGSPVAAGLAAGAVGSFILAESARGASADRGRRSSRLAPAAPTSGVLPFPRRASSKRSTRN